MSHHDGASSHFGLRQRQPGLGRGSARYPVDDRRSICSANSQNARSPLTVSEVGVVTPAQAYASAVRTGESYDRALYYTIERKQPERKRKADPQLVASYLGDPGSPRRGLSFAQRLYASALSDGSSTQPSSNIPILPPIKHPSSSALPMSGGSQVSCGVPHRKTSHSTSLFDTSPEVSQSFHPSDLYHTSVATHGFPSWGSPSPEVSATRPQSLLPALQITKALPAARLSHPANPLASRTPPKNLSPRSGVQNPRPVLHQSRNISMEAQSYSTPALSVHEASDLQGVSVETHQGFHPPVVAGGAILSSSPLEQQLVNPHSSSPPPLEEHERLSNLLEEVVANDAPVVIQPPSAVPQGDGLLDSLLEPPPDVDLEDVPLYSLVDDQLPPPTFDDLQETSTAEASAKRSPVLQPQVLPEELVEAPSSQSPPSQLPPSFSHGSTAYALLDQTSYSVGTRKGMLQDAKIPLSSITTWRPSDSSLSDPPNAVPIDFKWSNPIPPSRAPHDGPSMTPLLPCSSRPPSVLFSHSPDSQFTSISYDPLAIRKSSPPLVNHHTKPTAEQSGQPFPLLLAPTSNRGTIFLEGSNTVSQARRDSRPHVSAAEDNDAIDTLTRSMSDMMGGPSSDAHSLAYENLSPGRPDILGISLGKKQNIPIIPASHPSEIPNSMGSLNQETHRPEAERLIPETYQRPTHAEIGGRVGYGIQGLGSVATNMLSSQHSPRTVPSSAPIPPACSHEELQTESSHTTRDGSIFSQFGETVALSTRRSSYSDQPHIASLLPSRSFPHPLQPSYHPIDRGTHGPVAPSGTPQQHNIHSLEILDPMKRGGHVLPPPPPPPIALQPWNVPQMPHTSSHSQGGANDQFHLGNKGPARSNDLAKKVAHDALLDRSSPPAYACYGSNQR